MHGAHTAKQTAMVGVRHIWQQGTPANPPHVLWQQVFKRTGSRTFSRVLEMNTFDPTSGAPCISTTPGAKCGEAITEVHALATHVYLDDELGT